MVSNSDADGKNLAESRSLIQSASQIRQHVLNNDHLFTKSNHFVELIRLDPDVAQEPKIMVFTESSKLSEHFRSVDRDVLHQHSGVEIL